MGFRVKGRSPDSLIKENIPNLAGAVIGVRRNKSGSFGDASYSYNA